VADDLRPGDGSSENHAFREPPYRDFLAPGILAQSVTFIAIFYGISAIWERDSGVLTKYLVSPAPRWALVLGKGMGSGVRSLTQAVLIFLLAAAIGVHVRLAVLPILGLAMFALLGFAIFATFSLIVACIVQTRERFMGIGQLLTMPLFFASNAIYPVQLMPAWLQSVGRFNPLTYLVDALRALMLVGAGSAYGLSRDFLMLALLLAGLVAAAAAVKIYRRSCGETSRAEVVGAGSHHAVWLILVNSRRTGHGRVSQWKSVTRRTPSNTNCRSRPRS